MSYVQSVLQPGEQVIVRGRLHWIMALPGWIALLAGLVVAFLLQANMAGLVGGLALAGLGLILLIRAWFQQWTTEIAVTDRRFLVKRGFIRRITYEMNQDKVETVEVDQSVFGRLMDFGTVIVRGTGSGIEGIRYVASPLRLRSAITAR